MFKKFIPKQESETLNEFIARVEADAIENKESRIEILKNIESREERRNLLNRLTGLAIEEISHKVTTFCRGCGKEEIHEPLHCRKCGEESYIQVWYLKTGEYYITGEEMMKRAKNVQVNKISS